MLSTFSLCLNNAHCDILIEAKDALPQKAEQLDFLAVIMLSIAKREL